MTCEKHRTEDGVTFIVCTRGKRHPRCGWCHRYADRQCDAPKGRGTCSRYVCLSCAKSPGAGVDLCPEHHRLITAPVQLGLPGLGA
jgi:hypothetical protein